jgi:hypothetical protein
VTRGAEDPRATTLGGADEGTVQVVMMSHLSDTSDADAHRRSCLASGGMSSVVRLIPKEFDYAYATNPFSLPPYTYTKKDYPSDLIGSRDKSRIIYCLAHVPSEAG